MLSLAKHLNVYVKVSALLFRNTGDVDAYPYHKVKSKRFDPLMQAFGAKRLMMGSDFPFAFEKEQGYKGAVNAVKRGPKLGF